MEALLGLLHLLLFISALLSCLTPFAAEETNKLLDTSAQLSECRIRRLPSDLAW